MAFVKNLLLTQISKIPDSITLSLLINIKIRILLSTIIIARKKEIPVFIVVASIHPVILAEMIALQQITADIKGKSFSQTFGLDFNYRTLLRMITCVRIRHQSDRLNLVNSQIIQFRLICNLPAIDIIRRCTFSYHFNGFTPLLYTWYLTKQIIQSGLFGKDSVRHISSNSIPVQFERFPVRCNLHSFEFSL